MPVDRITLTEATVDLAIREFLSRRGVAVMDPQESEEYIHYHDPDGGDDRLDIIASVPVDLTPPSVLKPGVTQEDVRRIVQRASYTADDIPSVGPAT